MDKKYEILKDTEENFYGIKIYRIRALKDFSNVKKGDIGGYLEHEGNLSQKGNCWIYDDAKVYGNAEISGNAKVFDCARVYGNAIVSDSSRVYDNAQVCDDAIVCGIATVWDNAKLYGDDIVS